MLSGAQGFDFDYAGVIIGPDLDPRWVPVRSADKHRDQYSAPGFDTPTACWPLAPCAVSSSTPQSLPSMTYWKTSAYPSQRADRTSRNATARALKGPVVTITA